MTEINKPHDQMDDWLKKYRVVEVQLKSIKRCASLDWPENYKTKFADELSDIIDILLGWEKLNI
jgi:Asp-tRNA(Asn)/Glu-tRNA(Gln) amidotransferase C subunit